MNTIVIYTYVKEGDQMPAQPYNADKWKANGFDFVCFVRHKSELFRVKNKKSKQNIDVLLAFRVEQTINLSNEVVADYKAICDFYRWFHSRKRRKNATSPMGHAHAKSKQEP